MPEIGAPPVNAERVRSPDLADETAVCLFAFGDAAEAPEPPEAPLEQRLLWRRAASLSLVGLRNR